ncbi:MAG: hypothetical protein KI792_12795 [Alphaproteobacteria bacterium]|nr:hypothetical protein [Alphaproteobacteria bacterium SS10]
MIDPSYFDVDSIILRPHRMEAINELDFSKHRMIINAISDPDLNPNGLKLAKEFCKRHKLPVVNPPERIVPMTRDWVSQHLADTPNLLMPKTVKLTRKKLTVKEIEKAELEFPVLARPVGRHGAIDLVKHEDPQSVVDAMADYPNDDAFYITEFVDFRDAEGLYWKTRVIYVGGSLAIRHHLPSEHWIVNASQREQLIDKRPDLWDKELEMIAKPVQYFTEQGIATIRDAMHRMRLDYCGMDCARMQDGRIVVFEANPAMNLLPIANKGYEIARRNIQGITRRIGDMLDYRLAMARVGNRG